MMRVKTTDEARSITTESTLPHNGENKPSNHPPTGDSREVTSSQGSGDTMALYVSRAISSR